MPLKEVLIIKTDENATGTASSIKTSLLNAIGMSGARLGTENFSVKQLENNEWEISFVAYQRLGILGAISSVKDVEIVKSDISE